jgi:hypothetical protein
MRRRLHGVIEEVAMEVPRDNRRQYSMMDIALAHAFGGGPSLDQVQQILPGVDLYVQPNAWPRPSRPLKKDARRRPASVIHWLR